MADVTGPISTLPSSRHDLPDGAMCDDHPERPAVTRVQGETDSFGSEMHDLCQECLDAHRKEVAEADHSGTCDWCKEHKPRLRNRRDDEEGSYGPVYLVCDDCCRKRDERLAEEMSRYEPLDDYYEDDDDDEWLAELEAHEESWLSEEELEACKARGDDNQRPQGGDE